MKVLELFSGTASFSKAAAQLGHEVFTIDVNSIFNPNLCKDILDLTSQEIIEQFGYPDFIWASPPCTTFSVASLKYYWKDGKPLNEKTLKGIEIVKKTIKLIQELNPKFFVIENPRGMLRKQDFMQILNRTTVTYCQYGLQYQKATDLWHNLNSWQPKPVCSPKSPCHVRSPRGSQQGIQGVTRRPANHPDFSYVIDRKGGAAIMRAIVPEQLCLEILNSINIEGGEK